MTAIGNTAYAGEILPHGLPLKDFRALLPFVLLAIALHAGLLLLVPWNHVERDHGNEVLEVYMPPLKSQERIRLTPSENHNPHEILHKRATPKHSANPENSSGTDANLVQMQISRTETPPPDDSQASPKGAGVVNQTESGPPVKSSNIQTLLNSAHQMAREAGKGFQESKEHLPLLSDRPVLPELAKMLAKNNLVAGVTEYADGVIKVVTPSGNVYCMQPKSNLPQDGPVQAESIPMTCP